MKVLMLGVYELKGYSRGRILYKGLKKNKVDVDIFLPKKNKYVEIAKRILKKDYDVLLVNGKLVFWTAWILKFLHRKPIVLDVFISDYDTLVKDRKLVKDGSLKAKLLWLNDKYACHVADKVILDTDQHIDYFVKEFRLKKNNFEEVLVGSDDEIFFPKKKTERGFYVTFYGTFIPLQGIEYILRAAKSLEKEPIKFKIIGKGQTYDEMMTLKDKLKIKNIEVLDFIPLEVLSKNISEADICLGIFGHSDKATRVIPNKAFDTIAMKKPLITSSTPATRAFFKHKENAYLCKIADHRSLANAILKLKKDTKLRNRIADGAYKLYKETSNPEMIGKKLNKILDNVIKK